MNISFFLDVKLVRKNDQYYTTGAVDENYLNKHKINKNDFLTVVCRENLEKNIDETKLAKANGENINFLTFTGYQQLFKRRKQIEKIVKESDFSFVKMPTNVGIIACQYLNKYKKKYVIEMVGSPFGALWNYGTLKAKIVAPIMALINKYYIKKAKNVIYVTKEYLQKVYPTTGKSISCSDVKIEIENKNLENRLDKIEHLNLSKDIIKIGLVGSLNTEYKGHRMAIEALRYIMKKTNKKCELHFLGDGNRKTWEQLAKKYNIENQIRFEGTLPSGKPVYRWLDDMDIYIIPSYTEGLPRTLIEAMSRACPCIGSKVGGIPELIDFTFRKKDSSQLAKCIINMLDDKNIMKQQAKLNFEKSKQYNSNDLEKLRERFIQEIINEE